MHPLITYADFEKIELRTGTILHAEPFPEARKPAYKITIDFGERGIKQTSAQITNRYQPTQLIGMQVVAVLNLPPKRIAGFSSECLLLGAVEGGSVILLNPEQRVPNGLRIA